MLRVVLVTNVLLVSINNYNILEKIDFPKVSVTDAESILVALQ